MAHQLAMCHLTDGVNEVPLVEVLETILVRIMGVGAMVEIVSQRIFNPILIVSILEQRCQDMIFLNLLFQPISLSLHKQTPFTLWTFT